MAEERDTNPMSLDEHLRAVWHALEIAAEATEQLRGVTEKQVQEIDLLRLRIQRLEDLLERLPTRPLSK